MICRLGAVARSAAVAVAAAGASLIAPGCYEVPKPDCGFVCGAGGACPADYTCNAADNRCHYIGASPSLVCPTFDASVDAPADAARDALPDAPIDAVVDAPIDAPPIDAPPIDAPPIDAPPVDAPPIDAPPVDAPSIDAPPIDAP